MDQDVVPTFLELMTRVLEEVGDHGRVEGAGGVVEDDGLGLLHGQHSEHGVSVTRTELFLDQAPLVRVTAQQE